MRTMTLFGLRAGLAVLIFAGAAFAGERWKDETTGTHFMLEGKMSWKDAHRLCRERGWDLFNFEYLSKEEQGRFLQGDTLRTLSWERKWPGEPGERRESEIWMSSEISSFGSDLAVTTLVISEIPGQSARIGRVSGATAKEGERHALCFYQSHSWIGCQGNVVCNQPGLPTPTRWRYSLFEYGPNRDVVHQRMVEKIKKWPTYSDRCDLDRITHCLTFR